MKTQTATHTLTSPRDYAAAVLAEPSLDGRKRLMERCPADWRSLVEEHVRSAFPVVAAYRRHQRDRIEGSKQKPPAAPRRTDTPNVTNHRKSVPEVGNAALAQLRAAVQGGQ
ncbi:hypothetical protein V0R48_18585 [Pseudomonas alcaligenes]|uniref:hypothetical protein n=1 Tax=Aquipseudomonas alcaligenes TaxID=43263 RepID=UPI002E7B71E9|nr:hypothetical protein [Pseudomonas alcaligenes]MEE1950992.1 hypothetical protein [Pseudomonas alcaligenes]